MANPGQRRGVERSLLAFVTLLLIVGFGLVYAAKMLPSVTPVITSQTLNVNAASADQLAHELSISRSKARELVEFRDSRPGHAFPSVYSVRNSKVLKGVAVDWQANMMCVRTPAEVRLNFTLFVTLFVIAFWAYHLLLTRKYPAADPYLLPLVMFLAGVGLLMVFSVKDPFRDSFSFVTQARGVVLASVIAGMLPLTAAYRKLPLHRYGFAYAAGAILLMFILMSPLGHGPAGAKVMALGFEPVEIIKVLLVFFVASYLAERRLSLQSSWTKSAKLPELRDLIPLAAMYLFVLLLFAIVKDMGPAVLLYGTFVTLVYLVTGRALYPMVALVLLLVAGAAGYALHFGFFATRVDMWLHPLDNHNRLGGQLAMGLWGMATGGVFGTGLGLGNPALVPRAGSDMVFTSIGEELGLVGSLTVLIVYAVIILRGFRIARNAVDDFDRLLAAGLTTLIGIQAIVITGGATGLVPLTGVTLPFVSYGTSSLMADFLSIGILMRISAKQTPSDVASVAPQAYPRAARVVVTTIVTILLAGVGIGRLIVVQGVQDKQLATQALRIPDADKVVRKHYNPRLEAMALTIPRGSIFDRNGNLLARNAKPGEPGVRYFCNRPRVYPYGPIGANIVLAAEQRHGTTNPIGCDEILSGLGDGSQMLELYRRRNLPFAPHPKGTDVTLTLDIALQKAAMIALNRAASEHGNGRGAAVALDATSGELLAAATAPTFNPNTLTNEEWDALHSDADPANPLLNRPFAGVYPPGSTFKLVTATAALNAGHSDFRVKCAHDIDNVRWTFNGKHYSRRRITDETGMPSHGNEGMANAVRVSCNVYFGRLAIDIGATDLEHAIQAYHFSYCPTLEKLGEDLPDCGYGQGQVLATPLEMARVSQTIAAKGVLAPALFVKGVQPDEPPSAVMTSANAIALGTMMRGVVANGTAKGVFDSLGVDVAGKTGSAQLNRGKTHSWFTGYAPFDTPKIAFACVIEHGGYGRTAAASVCREMIRAAVK
jgi:cell division protein FtsI/penicillin-binding protein 2/cell division protein FtsW (lipid II flippase)